MNASAPTPYVFISYAHVNSEQVLPVIQALSNNRINAWYDRGIEAGSEWPEFIAEKVVSCQKFVLFVSNAYLESQNCKRELNFAISRKKEILAVFLENVQLTPGMEMQLGSYQAIFRNRFPNHNAFCQSVSNEPFFYSCRLPAPPQPAPQTQPAQQPNPQPQAAYQQPRPNPQAGYQQPRPNPQPQGGYQQPRPNPQPQGGYQQPRPTPQAGYQQQGAKPQGGVDFNGIFSDIFSATPPAQAPVPVRAKLTTILLAFFLGGFGAHLFYVKKTWRAILYLVLCWTYIPTLISIVECIYLFVAAPEKLYKLYGCCFN